MDEWEKLGQSGGSCNIFFWPAFNIFFLLSPLIACCSLLAAMWRYPRNRRQLSKTPTHPTDPGATARTTSKRHTKPMLPILSKT